MIDLAQRWRTAVNVQRVKDAQRLIDARDWIAAEEARHPVSVQRHGSASSSAVPSLLASGTPGLRFSALPTTGDYHAWPDWPRWHAVGLCEQRGTGQYDTHGDGIAWGGSPAGGFPDSGYPGGLGMSVDFWREFAPAAGVSASNGAYASPSEQIRVARAGSHDGTRMRGWSSWTNGCVARNGG